MRDLLQEQPPTSTITSATKMTLFVVVIVGFLLSFVSGYVLHTFLRPETGGEKVTVSASPTSKPTTPATDGSEQPVVQMQPGKDYYLDSVIMVSKQKPNYTFVTSVSRLETDNGYTQNVRTSYFDGKDWTRKLKPSEIPSTSVVSNSLLTTWKETIHETRLLRETVEGSMNFDGVNITFKTEQLENEIGMRSLPSNTKFMSNGEGSFTLNGVEYEAYVLFTKQYSDNAAEIQVYDGSLGITTNWLAFWDERGNFYHIDVTDVERPTPTYQSHQIGIWEDPVGRITKTFEVDVERNEASPPDFYTMELKGPINATIQLEVLNHYNKIPSQNSYQWILGQVQGEVVNSSGERTHGIGLLEYIYN